jgi:dTDP-4-amino-4,6-dideoxygalactose transaminase
MIQEPIGCESNYWLQTLILEDNVTKQRDEVLQATNDALLMTRPAWRLMHQLPCYQECPRAPLAVAESLAQRIINIPSSAGLV